MIFPLTMVVIMDVQQFPLMEAEHVRFKPLPDTLRADFVAARNIMRTGLALPHLGDRLHRHTTGYIILHTENDERQPYNGETNEMCPVKGLFVNEHTDKG